MRPTVNSDEFVTSNRSANVATYTDHSSRRRKEQISNLKNAQTEHETHLSQNDAHSSTYRPNRELPINAVVEDHHQGVSKSSEKTEQKHKATDTWDIDSLRRYQWDTTDEESCTELLRLWCARCRRKKKCLDIGKPTRRFLERIKKSEECEKSDEAVAGVSAVSTAPYRESISRVRSAPEKSKRSHKQDATVEVTDKDVPEKVGRRERTERKKREREEQRRKERKEKERKERRERRKREERMLDARLIARDEDHVTTTLEDRVPGKMPLADLTKTCCYLCAQNTLTIVAATTKPEQSDKCVQVSAHKFCQETPTLDKSCSPMLLVRTVQSSVKVKTRETSTLCPGTSAPRKETKSRTKRKKFSVFPRLTRTKCPAGQHAACETDKSARRDNTEKREPRNEKCCREKN